jgi:Ca2+-binding RTX toxin-like protein
MSRKISTLLLRPLLAMFIIALGVTCSFTGAFAQGANCSTAPFVVINPPTPPKYNLAPGAQHFFRVSMPSLGQLTISTESATLSTDGALYYADGRLIASNRGFRDFLISRTSLPPGTYCISVKWASSSGTGQYWLRVDGDLATDTPGGSHPTSAFVVRSNLIKARLAVYNDFDYFQIQVPPGGGLVTVAAESAAVGTDGSLYYADGRLIAHNRGFKNFSISKSLTAGIYYVKVQASNLGEIGDYWLRVSGAIRFPSGTCAGVLTTIVGTEGDDVLTGTDGNDVIAALGGNDIVYGLGGNDIICGGSGDDVLFGGDGNDVLLGELGNNVLRGENGNDILVGGPGVDVLDGGSSNDQLFGQAGNDTLIGGTGNDKFDGGLQADVCVKDSADNPLPVCEFLLSNP